MLLRLETKTEKLKAERNIFFFFFERTKHRGLEARHSSQIMSVMIYLVQIFTGSNETFNHFPPSVLEAVVALVSEYFKLVQ